MNQYEIELRDKYFTRRMNDLFYAKEKMTYYPPTDEAIILIANEFADKCMAERQKHLDAEGYNAIDEVHKRYKERVEKNGGMGDKGNVGISSGIPL